MKDKLNEVMEDLLSDEMLCLDEVCRTEAEETEAYNGIPIRLCKNGHRTGVLKEDKEVV